MNIKLSEYAEKAMLAKGDPNTMSDLNVELASVYATLTEEYQSLKIKKALFWKKKFEGVKPLSDTYLEMLWTQSEDGQRELKLKYDLAGIEKLFSSVKSSIVVETFNMRNSA